MLSSMLSGAAYGTELGDMAAGPTPGRDGHFLFAIKVGAFEDVGVFRSRVDGAIRQLHACRLAPGYERVYAPGEPEALRREAYARDGVPLNDVTLADLRGTPAVVVFVPFAFSGTCTGELCELRDNIADFDAAGVAQSDEQILRVMTELMIKAGRLMSVERGGSGDAAAVMLARNLMKQ